MNGAIRVESEPGKGSTFIVDLPFERSGIGKDAIILKDAGDMRVLAVDDGESERNYMSVMLERMGVRHTCVENCESALAALKEAEAEHDAFNICLIDWRMPHVDGIETTKQIRQRYGDDMIVIVVSAYEQNQASENAKAAGANLFIAKPLFQSTLFDLFMTLTGGTIANQKQRAAQRDLEGRRVLLAEDNEMNRIVAKSLLESLGVLCECAVDGGQAVERFVASEEGYYDAVLMDIQMPVMDGYEAAMAIRKSAHPRAASIQIIALTANAFNEDIAKALSAGMNAHVAKPIELDLLAEALETAFVAK